MINILNIAGKFNQTSDEEETLDNSKNKILDEVNEFFKWPIHYNSEKSELKTNIIEDLELIETTDPSCSPIYTHYFQTADAVSTKVSETAAKYYTTDTLFLEDTQRLLKTYVPPQSSSTTDYQGIIDTWHEIHAEQGFKEKYGYMDWEMVEFLNKSEIFLQFLSMYNLLSPVMSLLIPVVIITVPFFIIKMKGLQITLEEYIRVLKVVAEQNAIGKIFTTNFREISSKSPTRIA
jgi:hypothetical protein